MPPIASLALIFNMTLLLGVNFVIVIPTADDYAQRLGGDRVFGGLLIGIFGFGAMTCIGLCHVLLGRVTLKTLLSVLTVGSVLGNTLYALAGLMGLKWTLVASRYLQGLCIALNLPTQYIAVTVALKRRSEIVLIFSGINTFGYALGPALAAVIEEFVTGVHIHNLVLDSDTAPGWFMALAYLVHLVLVLLMFEDLPMELTRPPAQQGKAEKGRDARLPVLASCATFWSLFMGSSMITIIEVYSVHVAKRHWGWSVTSSALFVALLMFVSGVTNIAMGHLARRRMQSDRAGLLASSVLGCVACVPLFQFALRTASAELAVLTPGLLLALTLAGLIRAFGIALASKVVPSSLKFLMNNLATVNLTLGRGAGGLIGVGLEPSSFAPLMLGMFAVSVAIGSISYSQLVTSAQAD